MFVTSKRHEDNETRIGLRLADRDETGPAGISRANA